MCLPQEQTEWKKKSQSNNDGKSKVLKKKQFFFLTKIFYITLREENATFLKPDSNFMWKCSSTDGKGHDASAEEDLNLGRKCCPYFDKGASVEEMAQPFSQLEIKSHKGKKITKESRWETTNIYRTNIWGNTVIPSTHRILLRPMRLTELFWTRKKTEALLYMRVCVCVCACVCMYVCARTHSLSCVKLFVNPWTVARPPGPSVHGILQARILVVIATSFSRGSSWPTDRTCVSCIAGRFFTR